MAFLAQSKAKLCKILIITLVFEKNANFFAENCRKSQKIVIITSTPDLYLGVAPDIKKGHIWLLHVTLMAALNQHRCLEG
jgi:hypothetical protein